MKWLLPRVCFGRDVRRLLRPLMWAVLSICGYTYGADNRLMRYDIRVWQTDEGLPQNTVNAIAQTTNGYLWVGTREGLARFDGVRFTPLDDPAAPYLKQSAINALCVTRDGSLWIASESNGLTRFKDGVFKHFLQGDGLPDNQIQCLLESRDGGLWIGGETGLVRYKDHAFSNFSGNEMLHNNSIKSLHEDADGLVRVATVTGLVSVDATGIVSTNNFGIGPVPGILKAVREDRDGRLWVGTTDGLVCWTDGKRGSYAANKSYTEKVTTVLLEDHAGQLWIGSYAGLTRRVNGALADWWAGTTGVDDVIFTVFEDREQNIWVGGRDGLYRLSPVRLTMLAKQDGLSGNNVVSLLEDHTGAMWFAIWGNGLTCLKNGKFSTITRTNGLSYETLDKVLSLWESRDGSLWVGMDERGGLNRLGSSRSNNLAKPEGLLSAPVRAVFEDQAGEIWIGTGKGLNVLRGGRLETFTTAEGLAGNNVTVICQDRQSNIWIGTDGGLSRWTGTGFVNLTSADGLSQNSVNALYEDSGGELWIGTRSGGLNRLKNGKLTSYTTRQGLFSDEVFEILEDDSGHLWMSCRRGIFRVERRQFDALDAGELQRLNCTTFGREDGLATVQCSGVAKPAGWKSRDGRLWFATIRGAVAVESHININEQPPTVVVEEIMVDGQKLRPDGSATGALPSLEIPPGSGRLEIHYTALSLQSAEKNRFKYQLRGFDETWVDAGHQRVASYINVPPGQRYRFRVIACNNDGIWNETGTEIAIYMGPHFWQTFWFKAALVVLPFLLMALFYRARVERLRELENLRIRIAADLHDDVGSRLTKVAMVTELADRETPTGDASKPHIQNITRTVRDITRAMDEIVWTINPRNDTLENLANYIFHYAQEYFQDTGVRCRLDLPPDLPDLRITTEERHNVFMAVKEALNNILKHAAASEVRITLGLVEDQVLIEINDNGRGIAAGRPDPTGEGMTNMRSRLDKIGGEFKLRSRSDGTTITMRLQRR